MRTLDAYKFILRIPHVKGGSLQAAAAALNVNAAQYTNLIPLSFDQDEFIRQEEEKRMKKREKLLSRLYQNQ